LRDHTHRTNDGEFLWRSAWDESAVLQAIALDTLKRLHRKGEPLYFVIDDTQVLKRAKKMDGVGRLYHAATGTYGDGHTILKVCLLYRGVTIPWGSCVYVKKDLAPTLKLPFIKLSALAAQAIRDANLPVGDVTVLFDSWYLCPCVVQAVRARGWHFISVAKANRALRVGRQSHLIKTYAPNVLRRSGRRMRIVGRSSTQRYRVAERIGSLKKVGDVKVVFSRRQGESKTLAIVTDDLKRSARKVIAHYAYRWSIELLIKDEKQQLGLGAYRYKRYRAVVRHLHLVDVAYACLTHLGLKRQRAQGDQPKDTVLRLSSIRQLKQDLRQELWREAVDEVVRCRQDQPVIKRLRKILAA
jgi:SRSO17 transposase